MRMLEPVEVSSQPWICSYGQAPSHCGYALARTSYDGYAPMDMPLPTVDMPLPGSSMMDILLWTCFCPLWTARISYDGYAPMDMPLPAMAMDMPLPGPLMVDMLLPSVDTHLPESPLWICFPLAMNTLLSEPTTVDTSFLTEGYA